MNPKELSIHDYHYDLPDNRIAHHPLTERDSSKLLTYNKGVISESIFNRLDEQLEGGDLLVFNETRVIHARLVFQKETGARIEVFCLEPYLIKETAQAFSQKRSVEWVCLVGNAKRWKNETLSKELIIDGQAIILSVKKTNQLHDSIVLTLSWNADLTFAEVVHYAGLLPLPPYMNRDAEPDDEDRYQTVYAKQDGSVAAPTAGLHFTDAVFKKLTAKKIETEFLTLHVGAGTFKPVKADVMHHHEMHEERVYISLSLIEKIIAKKDKHKIVAVGTTSLRTLESLYWFGVKLMSVKDVNELFIEQWFPYENHAPISLQQSLETVVAWMKEKKLNVLTGSTQILIAPPYQLKVVDALITNFHQPESTLLLLVAACIGDDWRKVYEYALTHDFRFLSYGDSSILFKS